MTPRAKAGTGGIALVTVSLLAVIAAREGTKYKPYLDIANVWTVCEGITGKHVIPNKQYTRSECDALLSGEIEKHGRGLLACITQPISQMQYEALASWAFNIGIGAACGSTLVRLLNAGAASSVWCDELLKWNKITKAGKPVVIRGLTSRREAERTQCLA